MLALKFFTFLNKNLRAEGCKLSHLIAPHACLLEAAGNFRNCI